MRAFSLPFFKITKFLVNERRLALNLPSFFSISFAYCAENYCCFDGRALSLQPLFRSTIHSVVLFPSWPFKFFRALDLSRILAHFLTPIDPYASEPQNVGVHHGFWLNTSFIWMAIYWSWAGRDDVTNWLGISAIMARDCHSQGTGECNHRCGKLFAESA